MKKLFKYWAVMGFSVLAASCEAELAGPDMDRGNQVVFTIEDFIPEVQTKSAAQITDSEIHFQWSADDVIGIFPRNGWQTEFNMEAGAGTSTAVFDGGDWGLKSDATYYAYYPFSEDNFASKDMRERVSYSYEGQEACFADADGIVDLSRYDFMASGPSRVEDGNVNFIFKHFGALCRIRFESPATAAYSQIIIEAEDEVFSMSGNFDATDKDGDGIISFVESSEKTKQFKVLFPESNRTFEMSDVVELYFLMPPVDLSAHKLKFKLLDSEFNYYDADIESRKIEEGHSYEWDVELDVHHSPVGVGTANCYIVSGAGSYKFRTVKGNSSESVGAVASAEVLWESFGTDMAPNVGDIISDVVYSDGYISFNASNKKGNAVIAAKDASGKILWSWHIWLTDQPKEHVYNNNAGIMMDRNLGATSATPGDVGALGLLYQWGRKDPFLGGSSILSDIKAKSTNSWPSTVSSDASYGTIAYATEHPTTFITYNSYNYDWYYTGVDYTTDDTRWQSAKTIYDPCPAGYRVPDGGDNDIWSRAFGSSDFFNGSFDSTNRGFNFGSSSSYNLTSSSSTCWYPAAGWLDYYNGSLYYVGNYGLYWSCSPIGSDACLLYFDYNGSVRPWGTISRAFGFSVRCVRE